MTATVIDLEEVTTIVRRYRELGEVIADLIQQRDDLKARFASLVTTGFSTEIDGKPAFKRSPNRRFDLPTAVGVAHANAIPVAVIEVVDEKDLKARLDAAGYLDAAMLPGTGADRVQL